MALERAVVVVREVVGVLADVDRLRGEDPAGTILVYRARLVISVGDGQAGNNGCRRWWW